MAKTYGGFTALELRNVPLVHSRVYEDGTVVALCDLPASEQDPKEMAVYYRNVGVYALEERLENRKITSQPEKTTDDEKYEDLHHGPFYGRRMETQALAAERASSEAARIANLATPRQATSTLATQIRDVPDGDILPISEARFLGFGEADQMRRPRFVKGTQRLERERQAAYAAMSLDEAYRLEVEQKLNHDNRVMSSHYEHLAEMFDETEDFGG